MSGLQVYSIGNILMDILTDVTDEDIQTLGLDKGIMRLVEQEERKKILDFIQNKPKVYQCGGSAPNTTITLSSLGIQTGLSGKVGKDDIGQTYIRQLEDQGVESFVSIEEGHTGTCIILITPDSERTMNTDLAINREYNRGNIDPDAIKNAQYFYFTGYMWDTEEQKDALNQAIAIAREKGTKIVFDLADPFAVNRSRDDFQKMIHEHYDIVFANREEARLMFGHDDIEASIKELASLCEIAVVKDGKHGSYVAKGDRVIHIPVNKVQAVDSTGAGDTYAAGFLYGLCSDYSLEKSGHFASWLASQIVRKKGAQFGSNELEEIRSSLNEGSWDPFPEE